MPPDASDAFPAPGSTPPAATAAVTATVPAGRIVPRPGPCLVARLVRGPFQGRDERK